MTTPFEAWFSGIRLKSDFVSGRSSRQTLLIHGAGASDRRRFDVLRSAMLERGLGSIAFDCIGHGETGGLMQASSLASRTRQAEAVIAAQPDRVPSAVVGTSMGAYNAIKLLETTRLDALILVVPAVYAVSADELEFGPAFTAAIRAPRSWESTDAWRLLAGFTGRLLVIAAEHDKVIPAEIPERLVQSAHRAEWRRLHVVRDAEHNRLFSLLAERPADLSQTLELVFECLGVGPCEGMASSGQGSRLESVCR